ncbi:MAG: hypothetical protein KatS3mg105_1463 [Gemmatales bacterium]|nr:MAG: hypothetical protein KatS3mg105_1463 [Gemmatales bacterium]
MINWIKKRWDKVVGNRSTKIQKCRDTKLDIPVAATIGVAWPAQVYRLSREKVTLIVGLWHKPGSTTTITLRNRRGTCTYQVEICVLSMTNIDPVKGSTWVMEAGFVEPLTDMQLRRLMQ